MPDLERPVERLVPRFDGVPMIPETPPTPKEIHVLRIKIPSEVIPYKDDLRRHMDACVYKFKVHYKKGRWSERTVVDSLAMLKKEVEELEAAIKGGNLLEIQMEAADVSNFACIIAAIAMERGE